MVKEYHRGRSISTFGLRMIGMDHTMMIRRDVATGDHLNT